MTTAPSDIEAQKLDNRSLLRPRLLANPNYFGTAPGSPLKPVYELSDDTTWEQLTCVGYNPVLSQLEAVVSIKLPFGYVGDLCTPGSTEYVRFFVDFGSGLTDVGLASIQVHDIPDPAGGSAHPIEYLVSLPLNAGAFERCCSDPVLPNVRATLSWNVIPSTDPTVQPVFGNQLDTVIQLPTSFFGCWKAVLEDPPPALEFLAKSGIGAADLAKVKPSEGPQPVPWHTLIEDYERAEVPQHRLVYPAIYPMMSTGPGAAVAAGQADLTEAAKLGINLTSVIEKLGDDGGNTAYEELTCAGLNTLTDTFGAVVHVKQSTGYNGDLCTTGSLEYVAFWADWDGDGIFESYLGTASVPVHDISTIPAGGLNYSVLLPAAIGEHLEDCSVPNVVNIRAVLSWAVPPSTSDPDAVPYWGDRLDALVQIRPGVSAVLYDLLYDVGSVPIPDISTATYLAYPSNGVLNTAACSQAPGDRPFGGGVRVGGRIYGAGLPGSVSFQVQYTPHGTNNWQPVTHQTKFELMHPNPADPLYPQQDVTILSTDGWFAYQENWVASPPILERTALLAWWDTTAQPDGPYDIRLAFSTDPTLSVILYSPVVTIIVDNTNFNVSPTANTAIDLASTLDIIIDGGDCHSYQQGDTITGELRAVDTHFWRWILDLQPDTHTHGIDAVPECRSYGSLADQGDQDATWSLNTGQLDKCGYTLTLRAYDRTILNSNTALWHWAPKAVGFSVI